MLSLIQNAKEHSQRTAIRSNGNTYTYNELLEASMSIAQVLLKGKADLEEARIAFMILPSFEYVAIQWGIWQAGGIAVPLCTSHPLPTLEYVVEDTQADIIIAAPEFANLLQGLAQSKGIGFLTLKDLTVNQKAVKNIEGRVVEKSRRAMIIYTSGSTGKPKGVVTTHANIEAQISTLVSAWKWSKEDHILNILPLHHVHGVINVVSCALWSGACVQFLPKFSANKVFDIFLEGQVNLFMAVPTIYYKLIAYYDTLNIKQQKVISAALSEFRLMVSGSAALPVSVLERWRNITKHTLLERYGMTEIGMAVSNAYGGERRPGHIGLPLPGVELRLVNESNELVPEGTQGEIQIKSPSVFLEYWQNPKASQSSFTSDGWFKTGDVAVLNDGLYRILGRNSVDIIKSGGYKISALEIEEILRTHPSVKDCGVVGIPNEEWGEVVAVSLVLKGNELDLRAFKVWMKEQLPAYRIPRKIIVQSDLPRNTLGKVTKNELKKLFLDTGFWVLVSGFWML